MSGNGMRLTDAAGDENRMAEVSQQLSTVEAMRLTVETLFEPGDVFEIRALNVQGRGWINAGYFNDAEAACRAVEDVDGTGDGVYVTLNPACPELLARSENRIRRGRIDATKDAEVMERRWILVDFDPKRPSGVSATDDEHDATLRLAKECRAWLIENGFAENSIVTADSGNGAHLLLRVDLPNDEPVRKLVEQFLKALDLQFSTGTVEVDKKTGNAARLTKFYGTMACKGDDTTARPWRRSHLLEVPEKIEPATEEQLQRIANQVPELGSLNRAPRCGDFNLEAWIVEHDLPVVSSGSWEGGRKWILNPCPWSPEHTNRAAYIVTLPNGAIAAGCHHNSCAGKGWKDLRRQFEPGWNDDVVTVSDGADRKRSQADELICLVKDISFFHTPDGVGYACVPVADHLENLRLDGKQFKRWLRHRYREHYRKVPGQTGLDDCIEQLEGQADIDGKELEVHTRVAEHNGKIYLDLTNEAWECVEISKDGWRIVADVPVRFQRSSGMQPLPTPERGGNLQDLRRFFNVNDENWTLLSGWLLGAFRPRGPYGVLGIHGEQGSGKSTATEFLRQLIDPNVADLRRPPRCEQDLMIAARNSWLITIDNASFLKDSLSDCLCCVASGGGFSTRRLYTNDEEQILSVQRPIVINGISEVISRGDLLDRAVLVELKSIPAHDRRLADELRKSFDEKRARILGALLDAVSVALQNLPDTQLDEYVRLADFELWVAAGGSALGFANQDDFSQALKQNRLDGHCRALEASPVAEAIEDFLSDRISWQGTATELLKELRSEHYVEARCLHGWPRSGRGMSDALRRLKPHFQEVGIGITFLPRQANRRLIRIVRVDYPEGMSPAADGLDVAINRRQRGMQEAMARTMGRRNLLERPSSPSSSSPSHLAPDRHVPA